MPYVPIRGENIVCFKSLWFSYEVKTLLSKFEAKQFTIGHTVKKPFRCFL